jgi:hypothetical protein
MNQIFLGYGVAVVAGELTATVRIYAISAPNQLSRYLYLFRTAFALTSLDSTMILSFLNSRLKEIHSFE